MPTTNLFALREARSNQECCFFRSTCPLGMSRQARQPCLDRLDNRVSTGFRQAQPPARQPPAADGLDQPIRRQVGAGSSEVKTEERRPRTGGKGSVIFDRAIQSNVPD